MQVAIVVAVADSNGGIGFEGGLPWPRLRDDIAHFSNVTTHTRMTCCRNAVIMGRRTWEGLPAAARPLRGRVNVVLTRTTEFAAEGGEGAAAAAAPDLVAESLMDALHRLRSWPTPIETAFVIGGVEPIVEALSVCDALYVTHVQGDFPSDVFIPDLTEPALATRPCLVRSPVYEDPVHSIKYHIAAYGRCAVEIDATTPTAPAPTSTPSPSSPTGEHQYLELVRKILAEGVVRPDRTGVGTLSIFGHMMRFSLQGAVMPLLTTKRVFWRGVAEELLWFISGSTDARVLQAKGIRIWDGNSSREFLDSRGLTERAEGDLGPVYGFQWRHFGASYTDRDADYGGKGIDQLKLIIDTLRVNPTDRRMVLSAWNPVDLHKMALPPCHMFAQFYVGDHGLVCLMYQRSADVGLGVPFNIASYALLTRLIAQVTNLPAYELVYVTGDTHIYTTHVDALKEQLTRSPRPFPTLVIDPTVSDIDAFTMDHFKLHAYDPHAPLGMPMAV